MAKSQIPLGIRNNNPGNLRSNVGLPYPTVTEDGFAKMRSLQDGAQAMLHLLFEYYNSHHYTTLFEVITHYAPATENDVTRYMNVVCQLANLNPLQVKTHDLELEYAWNAINLARAMVIVECGRPDRGWPAFPEWVSVGEWYMAASRTGKWLHV